MAKAILAYVGDNSVGVDVQVAQSENGEWYYREWCFNGYAKCWSKWEKMTRTPNFVTHVENAYTGEIEEMEDKTARLEWGFSRLDRLNERPKWRLPN